MDIHRFIKKPTEAEWNSELSWGWEGSDGSSLSTDTMNGVRIGITSRSFEHSNLPANLHDYRYHLGRRHSLGSEYRLAADIEFRDNCIKFIRRERDGWFWVATGVARAHFRYYVLRMFGWKAFRG